MQKESIDMRYRNIGVVESRVAARQGQGHSEAQLSLV